LADIVHHLFTCFTAKELEKVHIPKLMEWHGSYIRFLDEKQKLWEVDHTVPNESKVANFRSKTTGDVAKRPYVPVKKDSSLLDLWNLMVTKTLHRVPIVDENGKLLKIVTQIDLITWLDTNMSQFPELANLTMKRFGT